MGWNEINQLGDGTATNHPTPILIVPGVPPPPLITGVNLATTNLNLTASNGVVGEIVYTMTSTNLAMPLNQWQPIATNQLNANGNFSITATNAVNPAAPQQFYLLQGQ